MASAPPPSSTTTADMKNEEKDNDNNNMVESSTDAAMSKATVPDTRSSKSSGTDKNSLDIESENDSIHVDDLGHETEHKDDSHNSENDDDDDDDNKQQQLITPKMDEPSSMEVEKFDGQVEYNNGDNPMKLENNNQDRQQHDCCFC